VKRVCLFVLAALSPLITAAQAPVVRARLEPATGILVGQPVRLVVSVFVPNYFTGSPDFPEFELENAIVVLPQDRPQNSNEQIDGKTHSGITETYTIYPQQPGDFQLPPAEITVSYASTPPETTEARLPLPSLSFHAEVPASARDLNYFLPTTRLTIEQKWPSPLKNLRAGDSIERTITVTATKMQAMLIPPLPLEAPAGIRVYQEEPVVQDQKTDRGEFVYGRRTQSVKYFIQKEGDYTLPHIELKWWNLSTNRLVTATLPAVHFTAAANANYVAELPPEAEPVAVIPPKHVSLWTRYKFLIRVLAPCSIAFLLLLSLAWRYLPLIFRKLQASRKQHEHSEPAYFRNLDLACRRNRAKQAYEWLLKWLAIAYPGVTLHEFLSRAANPALSFETNSLGASLFAKNGQNTHWVGKKMADLLRQHRKAQVVVTAKAQNLLKLNP
jgi:BatD DUF11 like domain